MAAMPSILVGVESKDESNAQEYLPDCSENEIFMAEIMALLNGDPLCNTDQCWVLVLVQINLDWRCFRLLVGSLWLYHL